MTPIKCSVLMCVYAGDAADAVEQSLRSLIAQSRLPDEIILVEDGPLPAELSRVIETATAHSAIIRIVRLERNSGLIGALNAGIPHCHGELLFRMDADDIAHADRLEKQIEFMDRHADIGVLGSAMLEFDGAGSGTKRIKPVKVSHQDIRRQLPWRNPVNHPTVCIRRHLLPETGYPSLKYLEDYFLWGILISQGVKFHNLAEPLLDYRFDDNTLERRSGWTNFRNEVRLRTWMFRQGLVSVPTLIAVIALQLLLRFAPLGARRLVWSSTRRST